MWLTGAPGLPICIAVTLCEGSRGRQATGDASGHGRTGHILRARVVYRGEMTENDDTRTWAGMAGELGNAFGGLILGLQAAVVIPGLLPCLLLALLIVLPFIVAGAVLAVLVAVPVGAVRLT